MMNERFMKRSKKKMAGRKRCKVERSLDCIPLEGDEICRACRKDDLSEPAGLPDGAAPDTLKGRAGGER